MFTRNIKRKNDENSITLIYGPRQANFVLTAYASSEGLVPIAYASSEGSASPVPSLLAHTSSESKGTFRQKARSLAPLNGCACTVKICHDGMLEDTNSLDGAHTRNERQTRMYQTFENTSTRGVLT